MSLGSPLSPHDAGSLGDYDFVCASVLAADTPHMPSPQVHILRRFARAGSRVLFLNPPLRWLADYRDLARDAGTRARAAALWRRPPRQMAPGFWVCTPPPAVPLNRVRARPAFYALLRLNQAVYRAATLRAMRALGLRRPVLWIALEPLLGQGLIGRLGERLLVYHHTDHLAGFGVYHPELAAIERDVLRRSRLVVCTSGQLRSLARRHNPNAYLVPNAVDVEHFRQALGDLPEPADLRAIPRPRAIYVGQVEGRLDLDLVRDVTVALPEVAFVFVGHVVPSVAQEVRGWRRPNVHLLGPRPQGAVPAYLKWADVALIPHRLNELTRYMYPLKLHEYLAAGKPVVSTDLEPVRPFRDVVALAPTPERFATAVRMALTPVAQADIADRVRVAAANDWDARTRTVAELLRCPAAGDGA